MGFLIKEYAREQGMKLGDVARKLRMPLSNLSAIASGSRSVSLRCLAKIAGVLGCAVPELFGERSPGFQAFENVDLNRKIREMEERNYMGRDKQWVHRVMLAWRVHYGRVRRAGGS